ncbi:MAG: type II toxin-antitoxin system VapC family toxin [Acidobacteriia bacterium]|nr:type II toxin-antitoxin system VapC family toxin [Terriglobia bacterium]
MNSIVLDASALLAVLADEPGAEKLTPELLGMATSSTVNLAEVQGKLLRRGMDPDEAWEAALSPLREPSPFTEEHAKLAGSLVLQTGMSGLSLGDRACLALGMTLHSPVYTTDRVWKNLKLGVRIHVLR